MLCAWVCVETLFSNFYVHKGQLDCKVYNGSRNKNVISMLSFVRQEDRITSVYVRVHAVQRCRVMLGTRHTLSGTPSPDLQRVGLEGWFVTPLLVDVPNTGLLD